MAGREDLLAHLQRGTTTLCHCWKVTRRDGVSYGFTDHDRDLAFDGQVFLASSGLSAGALQQTTGLSVDNAEAVGALSAAAISEAELSEGRFDGAEVQSWLVNWADVAQRIAEFRGSFGEVTRKAGEFRVELRGQTERLNAVQGRVYQPGCGAVLGDAACGVDLGALGHRISGEVVGFDALGRLQIALASAAADRWFERGTLTVLGGAAAGLAGAIKVDRLDGALRLVELWQAVAVQAGDLVMLQVGCDKQAETCRNKFSNFLNFRGFPHIPGEDWLASYPVASGSNDGGSLLR